MLFPEKKENPENGLVERMGYGGVLLRVKQKLEPESILELEFELESMNSKLERVKFLGEVRWVKSVENDEYLIGVRFLLPSGGRMFKIFLSRNLHKIKSY